MRNSLRVLAARACGLVILVAAVAAAAALLSHNAQDPSLNTSGGTEIQNWLGKIGAKFADLLLQIFGFAPPIILAAVAAAAGARLTLRARLAHPGLRLTAALASLPLLSLGFAASAPSLLPAALGNGGGLGGGTEWFAGLINIVVSYIPLEALADFHLEAQVLALVFEGLGIALALWAMALPWKLFGRGARRGFRLAYRLILRRPPSLKVAEPEDADDGDLAEASAPSLLQRGRAALIQRARRGGKKTKENTAGGNGLLARLRRRKERIEPVFAGGKVATATATRGRARAKESPSASKRVPRTPSARRAAARAEGGGAYSPPALDLLTAPTGEGGGRMARGELQRNTERLEKVLREFGIEGEIVRTHTGPIVTRYELNPAPGIKTSRVVGLADDIARSMSAAAARIAVVPGASTIGIELPNRERETVSLHALLDTKAYNDDSLTLPIALGTDISGKPVCVDLARMPHLLVAGTTGSGKSVSLHAMLLSILYRLSPDECKLILVDPKMLELSVYDGIPHLITPVVTEPKKAIAALKWAVREMQTRYSAMSQIGARNLVGYNQRVLEIQAREEKLQTGYDPKTGKAIFDAPERPPPSVLPYIIVVVDEMADLMLVAGKEVENAVQRLSQMARAAGIHIIMATQRPSVDVITGTVKANFPTRVSFHVTSKIDSRTILGEGGAEQLLGQGDMLYMAHGGKIERVHGAYVSEREVERVAKFLTEQGAPEYDETITQDPDEAEAEALSGGGGDELYLRAKAVVRESGKISTSYLQRRLEIGYNKAANLVEQMETEGFVSPPNNSGRREILG